MNTGKFFKSLLFTIFCLPCLSLAAFKKSDCTGVIGAALDPNWVSMNLHRIKGEESAATQVVNDTIRNFGVQAAALNREVYNKHNTRYTKTIRTGLTADQMQSGRCWIFSELNLYRAKLIAEKVVKPDFEFSATYMHFFNMLEKFNMRTERAIVLTEKYAKDRTKMYEKIRKLEEIGDGGWQIWFAFLVEKYGLVPKDAMPESMSSGDTAELLKELNTISNEVIAEMINAQKAMEKDPSIRRSERVKEMRMIKERGTNAVLKVLVSHLGYPPESFNLNRYSKSKKDPLNKAIVNTNNKVIKDLTPLEFAKEIVEFNADDYVMVGIQPDYVSGHYTYKRSAIGVPMKGGAKYDINFLNLSAARAEELVVASIDSGRPVEFAIDMDKNYYVYEGILHPDIYRRDELYNWGEQEKVRKMTRKEERLLGETQGNHMMVITGVDKSAGEDQPPIKYLVQNSWGEEYGGTRNIISKTVKNGDFHLYREAFPYVTEIFIHKSLLSKAELEMLKTAPKRIKDEH